MLIETVYAHHKDGHTGGGGNGNGNGNGNGHNAPEIDGGEFPLALLALFCVCMLLKKIRKR
jgi:hypothetical protein